MVGSNRGPGSVNAVFVGSKDGLVGGLGGIGDVVLLVCGGTFRCIVG